MHWGQQRSLPLLWVGAYLLGMNACLRPIPAPPVQNNSTGSTSNSTSATEQNSGSTEQSSKSNASTEPSTSQSDDEGTSSESSNQEVPPIHELRRLTATQIRNALHSVFPPQDLGAFDAVIALPASYSNDAFDNDGRYQRISPAELARLQDTARRVGDHVAAKHSARSLSGCKTTQSERDCVRVVIEEIAGKLFRRPLDSSEVLAYLDLYDKLLTKDNKSVALAGLIQGLVASPHFHYIPPSAKPAQHPYLVAARLSLLLWNDLPDQTLTLAAKNNRLSDPKVLRAHAKRMLASPKAAQMIRDFYLQMLRLGAIQVRSHPQANTELLLQAFGNHIEKVHQSGTLDALWTLPVSLDHETLKDQFPGQYPGLLAHPVFNWIHAKPTYSDPIARGAVIREQIFCNALRAPPPDVQMLLPAPRPDATTRERFEIHRQDPACAACHSLIDPLGFGLEAYDHLGRFRDEENNKPIDDRGALVATDVNGAFQGVAELSQKLIGSADARNCLAEQWLSYALGRPLEGKDQELLDSLINTLSSKDKALQELILAIATSPVITDKGPTQ